ncbi:MAG: Lrp/AsnC family transcriptional regulator [Solirubrobacterales bacterium]
MRPFLRLASAGRLSDFDAKLIELLQLDGRTSYAQLARDLAVTERRVRSRVNALSREGTIRISAVTDPRALGYEAGALFAISANGNQLIETLVEELMVNPRISYVAVTAGRFTILAEAFCRDREELFMLANNEILGLSGVGALEIFPFLEIVYQEFTPNPTRVDRTRAVVSSRELDKTDSAIVRELSIDGRAPAQAIANNLEISESQVRHRIKALTEDGLLRVAAIINPFGSHYQAMAWLGVCVQPGASAIELAHAAGEIGAVTYVINTAGRYDALIEVACTDHKELLQILDEVRGLPGAGTIEAHLYLSVQYRPPLPL